MTFFRTGVFVLDINPVIPPDTVRQVTVNIDSLALGDLVFLSHPILDSAGAAWPSIQGFGNCQVTAPNTLKFRVWNSSGSNVNPGPAYWRYIWIRP
jgi:hypothetical protein